MKISFEEIGTKVIPHMRGGDGEAVMSTYGDPTVKIMRGSLQPGCNLGYHTHETNSEIIYILKGDAVIKYDDTEEHLTAGDAHYCPKGHGHRLMNESDSELVFLGIVPELG